MNGVSHSPPGAPLPPTPVSTVGRGTPLDPKLVAAAHEFEASLMQELLKPLQATDIFGEEDESQTAGPNGAGALTSSADGSGSALMSFGGEALAKALSQKGGMGIARRILDHFQAAETASGRSTNAGNALNRNATHD